PVVVEEPHRPEASDGAFDKGRTPRGRQGGHHQPAHERRLPRDSHGTSGRMIRTAAEPYGRPGSPRPCPALVPCPPLYREAPRAGGRCPTISWDCTGRRGVPHPHRWPRRGTTSILPKLPRRPAGLPRHYRGHLSGRGHHLTEGDLPQDSL